MPSLAVVIPMFNEEAGARACVEAVSAALDRMGRRTCLIVVEDGSADETLGVLEALAATRPRVVVVAHGANRGYGAALQTGVRKAAELDFDYVLFMDCDLTNSPDDIPRFVEKMDGGVDVIKATRYSRGGRVDGVPFVRFAISWLGNRVASALFGLPIHDCTNGFRAVKVSLLARMRLVETRFPIIMEELYWCRHLARSFAEVPVVLTNRGAGLRRTSFVHRPSVFFDYLKYPVKAFLGMRPPLAPAFPVRQGPDKERK